MLNSFLSRLSGDYLFRRTGELIREYEVSNPDKRILRLGIGDATLPLLPEICDAMSTAAVELSHYNCGYQDERGQLFLRESIASHYARLGVSLSPEEIFVSDGAKRDLGDLFDLFGDVTVVMQEPYYPPYLDNAIMRGLRYGFISANAENCFLPEPREVESYAPCVIILCSPNNPTGIAYPRELLERWVDFALSSGSHIIFDSAYGSFTTTGCPASIFEIGGARECAIEVSSLSKSAGFTGVRCGWSVIPHELESLSRMWSRRQGSRFNGLSYVTARGGEAALSEGCVEKLKLQRAVYLSGARAIRHGLDELGREYVGGIDSPYIWMKIPSGDSSWEYFRYLLEEKQVALTPGAGFGGEGYMRISAFGTGEMKNEE